MCAKYKCPACGGDDIEMTCAGYLGKDMNQAKCCSCEWKGRTWETQTVLDVVNDIARGSGRITSDEHVTGILEHLCEEIQALKERFHA